MGSSANGISAAEARVRGAEKDLTAAKANRDTAKKNGNYKSSKKNNRWTDGKLGNIYDYNVWIAQKNLKDAKEQLARAKKKK